LNECKTIGKRLIDAKNIKLTIIYDKYSLNIKIKQFIILSEFHKYVNIFKSKFNLIDISRFIFQTFYF